MTVGGQHSTPVNTCPENVRKTPPDPRADAKLEASIAALGLLENLVSAPMGPKNRMAPSAMLWSRIYRGMAADPSPGPAFKDRTRAREAGIELAPPPALLRPWRPSVANVDDGREPPRLAAATGTPRPRIGSGAGSGYPERGAKRRLEIGQTPAGMVRLRAASSSSSPNSTMRPAWRAASA